MASTIHHHLNFFHEIPMLRMQEREKVIHVPSCKHPKTRIKWTSRRNPVRRTGYSGLWRDADFDKLVDVAQIASPLNSTWISKINSASNQFLQQRFRKHLIICNTKGNIYHNSHCKNSIINEKVINLCKTFCLFWAELCTTRFPLGRPGLRRAESQ